MEADDQAIQTILLGLPQDIYAAVDSYETAQEIWLRVQQMMKGSDIGIQVKKDNSHASGSGDGVDTQSKVPDEQQQKVSGTNERAGVTPEVPDVPKYNSESEEESWKFSQDDEDVEEESDKNDDNEETKSDNDGDDLTCPNLSTYKVEDQEEEKADEEEEGGQEEEEEEDDDDDLYKDLNINLERSDAEMTDAQANQDTKDTHLINPSLDKGINSILNQDTQSDTFVNVPVLVAADTPAFVTTIPQLPIPIIQPLQQTPTSITTTTNPTITLPEIPNFASLFQFDQRVTALESDMSEFRQTSQFAKAVSSILSIVDTCLASKMKEAMDVDSTMMAIIKEQAADLEDQPHQEFNTRNEDVSPVREALNEDVWHRNPSRPPTPDREWNKTKTDDQLYKFREDDFKRLRRQDIEDILLLLVQDKLTNLNLEERYALNVALRMFTRRIVIQEHVEDLQLRVESYQKKINLKKLDTYRLILRRMTPYTAYPDIQGIIYKDEINRNRLIRTDELHKFSDVTLNHVRTAPNDIALRIKMEYLPKRKWSKQNMQRARVMINAIDKKLRDRRLMRSLEKFVGGRPYGGDLRLLERTL
ncbi:hypothetical protein Tco_0591556 [Tanacetum coccineum]